MAKTSSSLILLQNPKRCPRCFRDTVNRDLRRCLSCNCRLMLPEDNCSILQDAGERSFYVFFQRGPMLGWVHSDHLAKPEPNDPAGKLKDPGKNYGKRPLPANCSAQ